MKEKQIRVRLPLIVYVDGLIFYDAQNQLLSETIGSDTTSYTYDTAGNIRSVTGPGVTKTFTYDDTGDWKDLLTSVTINGETGQFTYESDGGSTIGNPTHYFNGDDYELTWKNGRQLASLTRAGRRAWYSYGADGIRTSKALMNGNNPPIMHYYTTQNGKIVREQWGSAQMDFIYDATGRPLALYYRVKLPNSNEYAGDSYYYETNQQGDVTGLYKITYNATTKSLSATRVASYEYDAWGNVTYSTGEMADINPLRYRGYYQDWESGYYYLQSRYYDPVIGRFINADKPELVDFNFSKNLFVYSGNNPTTLKDDEGEFAITALLVAGIACSVFGGVLNAATTAATGGDTLSIALSFVGGLTSGLLMTFLPGGVGVGVGALAAGVFSGVVDAHMQKVAGKKVNYTQSVVKGLSTFAYTAIAGAQGNALGKAVVSKGMTFAQEAGARVVTSYVSGLGATVLDFGTSILIERVCTNQQSGNRQNNRPSYIIHSAPTQAYIDSLDTTQGNRGHTYFGYTY